MMFVSLLVFWDVIYIIHGLPGAKVFRNHPGEVAKSGILTEPTCEQLKAMWRFSKRQSRAAELTNELPMYPDPFAENIWQPFYATSRSIGGRPVAFGKLTYRPKINPEILMPYLKFTEARQAPVDPLRLKNGVSFVKYPPQSGSFNQLKELVKSERARQLQQQRLAEQAMKEVDSDHYPPARMTYDLEPEDFYYSSDGQDNQNGGMRMEKGEGKHGKGRIMFPDLLAPRSSIQDSHIAQFSPRSMPYSRGIHGAGHKRDFSPSFFDLSAFHDDYSDYGL